MGGFIPCFDRWHSEQSAFFQEQRIRDKAAMKSGNIHSEVGKMKFVGVREFKQDAVKFLNEGSEIVVMKRKKPIARLVPVREKTAEMVLLEIGRVLNEAGISEKEALKALDRARQEIYG